MACLSFRASPGDMSEKCSDARLLRASVLLRAMPQFALANNLDTFQFGERDLCNHGFIAIFSFCYIPGDH